MQFTRSKIMIASALALSTLLAACSKSDTPADQKNSLTASAPITGEASTLSERNSEQRLINTLQSNLANVNISAKITSVKATEVPNIYWISFDNMPSVFATKDGKYVIQGDIVRLDQKKLENIGDSLQASTNAKIFEKLNLDDLIVYPAKGKTKHVVYIFTDVSCPYCHKLQEEVPAINAKGIEVRYIAWPRGEQLMPAMEAVWCSPDRKAAFENAITGVAPAPANCKNPVREQYALGHQIGVNGTPAIYAQDGRALGAYMTAAELDKRLNN